ncbi:hypothetical protein [Ideonella sp.]|uniref:hypothetical protein n=1 Tax=Ideonella sp. TaxID=1929293 RepID=UPI003BB67F82
MSKRIDIKHFLAEQGSLAASRGELAKDFRQTFADKLPADCIAFVASRIEKASIDAPPYMPAVSLSGLSESDARALQQVAESLQSAVQHWCRQATKAWIELWAELNDDQD